MWISKQKIVELDQVRFPNPLLEASELGNLTKLDQDPNDKMLLGTMLVEWAQ